MYVNYKILQLLTRENCESIISLNNVRCGSLIYCTMCTKITQSERLYNLLNELVYVVGETLFPNKYACDIYNK
jgi:hypothetical protein